MKRLIFFVFIYFIQLTVNGQRRPPRSTTTGPVVVFEQQMVTLYENSNFTGNSKQLAPGLHVLSDFDNITSSIKVPQGMVVYIYENAAPDKGYGLSADLLEDVPDLSVFDLSDKISFVNIYAATRDNLFDWARGKMVNGQFVAGHWERKRARGGGPNNSPPATASVIPLDFDPDDIGNIPFASAAEIDEFTKVQKFQMGVGVLGGETTKPFYYHHNKPGEEVYKYDKVIDPSRLPGAFFDWASDKLGRAGIVVAPFEAVTDVVGDIKDWVLGSSSTKKRMDCWYPVSEFKQTVCGSLKEDAFVCSQDYIHTQVTVDKDVCLNLMPSDQFKSFLTNRWTGETTDHIEGEVKSINLINLNTQTGKSSETTTPRNPLLLQIKKDENLCFHGPWMGDILDINLNVPIPLTQKKVELGDIDLRKNNEIHPVNQLWKRNDRELILIAIVDGTGYFQKIGNGEIEASGLHQRMRFYIAFLLPGQRASVVGSDSLIYDVNGIGVDFTNSPSSGVQAQTYVLKRSGDIKVTVNDNSLIRSQRTHKVFFDKIRKRTDGSVQGYIVVETEPINRLGGSINIFVKNLTAVRELPVLSDQ